MSGQIVWNGAGPNNNWNTGANWVGGLAPQNPSPVVVEFGGSTRTTPNVNAGPKTTVGISFNSTAASFILGGAALTIGASGVVNNSANLQTLNNVITLSAAQTWNAAAGDIVFAATIEDGGYQLTLASAAGKTLTINQIISGTGGVEINGAGTVFLNAANSYTGTTTVTAGTVRLGADGALGTGAVVLNGGTLESPTARTISNSVTVGGNATIGGAADVTFSGPIDFGAVTRTLTVSNSATTKFSGDVAGTAGLIKAGTGSLQFNAPTSFTGQFTLLAGTVTVSPGATLGGPTASLAVNGGAMVFNNAAAQLSELSGTGGTITFGAGHTLTLAQTTTTAYSGTLTGAGTLVLSGGGMLTLSGASANSVTGDTLITEGTLVLAKSGGVAAIAAGRITVGNGAGNDVLRLGASNQIASIASLRLAGGGLQLNNFSQSFGTPLSLTASSTIDFGSTAGNLAFASSSAETWSGSLTVLNYTTGSNTLRFGTDSSGLTSMQLSSITFAGYQAGGQIDASGYVTPVPEPGAYAAGIGIVALAAAWWRRRRGR